ncbi:hypothetical protein COO60DRAFT_1694976 [Scenedesmus sp. NREL 46B-D3]|nr:hypothetical protein COO60DRAFT_1694976 [Scenedesmus sp. NREL 46B-D3]
MAASNATQQQPGHADDSPDCAKQVAVPAPAGVGGLGLGIISAPAAVLAGARDAAASGLGLVTHGTAAAARLYVMGLVWLAHYQLVLLLYTLLGASAAVLASQQLAWGTGKAAVMLSWQTGAFALPAAGASALAAAASAGSFVSGLVRQLIGAWWSTSGASVAAAGQELLQSAAEAVPGGTGLLQLLSSAAACWAYAAQAATAAVRSSWRFLAAADGEDGRGISGFSVATQLLALGAAGAGWVGLHAMSAAEQLAVVVTARVLQAGIAWLGVAHALHPLSKGRDGLVTTSCVK